MLPVKHFSDFLIDIFGPDSGSFRTSIPCFYKYLSENSGTESVRDEWTGTYGEIYGLTGHDINNHLIGLEYTGLENMKKRPDLYLFSLQTYYYLILRFLAHFTFGVLPSPTPGTIPVIENGSRIKGLELFHWPLQSDDPGIREILILIENSADEAVDRLKEQSDTDGDLFGPLYQAVIARKIRHSLGEYYTPSWLTDFCLDKTGYTGDPDGGLLDPSCGSGIFLVRAISLAKKSNWKDITTLLDRLSENIHGYDINPLAVLTARFNCLAAVRELAGSDITKLKLFPNIKVFDPVAGKEMDAENGGVYKYVVGNPPWMRWLDISVNYRESIKPLWQKYGLFTQKGLNSRMGSAELDFSLLFTYACIDRFLSRKCGRLGFFITRECITSKKAGAGFRRFELLENNEKIKVREFHDFSEISPFEAANKTSLILLETGGPTSYPVSYVRWNKKDSTGQPGNNASRKEAEGCLEKTVLAARPVSGIDGPWQICRKSELALIDRMRGRSAYKARRGADIEPYGVYFVEVLEKETAGDNSKFLIRNMPELGKKDIKKIEPVRIEGEYVFPVIRGRDIKRWRITTAYSVVLPNKSLRNADVPEAGYLKENYPLTYGYLSHFRSNLLARKSSIVRNLINEEQFYTVFGVGDYTFSGLKVVWQRMSDRIKAAVINDPPGEKVHIPAASTSFIPFPEGNVEAAHYVCALLNSAPALYFFKSFSPPGRGFGTPSLLEKINIPELDKAGAAGKKLAGLSEHCHHAEANGNADEVIMLEREIDTVVCEIWELTDRDLEMLEGSIR